MKCYIAVIALLTMLPAAWAEETETATAVNAQFTQYIVTQAQNDGLTALIALEEIRQGGSISNVIETLETTVDQAATAAWKTYNSASGDEKDHALYTLKTIKSYRQAHPRIVEATGASEDWEKSKLERIQQVDGILKNIE